MNVIQWKVSQNAKIYVGIFVALFVVYLLIPKSPYKSRFTVTTKPKVRHTVEHYLRQMETNDTLFNLVTDQKFIHPDSKFALQQYFRNKKSPNKLIPNTKLQPLKDFDIETDVMVYLHIQKVGGTMFNKHLITDLDKGFDCGCTNDVITSPCYCKNKMGRIWLYSWFTVGWPCGLHADWTMLHECIDASMNILEGKTRPRRYFYVTLLRDPLTRYLSEWQHQRLGNHWEDARLRCDGKRVQLFDVRPCFNTDTWLGVTLDEFMECRENLATNRQTRMLADLTKSDCYRRNTIKEFKRAILRLDSAMENLQQISFFGLTEKQSETQHLFEKTFNMKFKVSFEHLNDKEEEQMVSEDEFINVVQYIELDIQLYLYAEDLFKYRLEKVLG